MTFSYDIVSIYEKICHFSSRKFIIINDDFYWYRTIHINEKVSFSTWNSTMIYLYNKDTHGIRKFYRVPSGYLQMAIVKYICFY